MPAGHIYYYQRILISDCPWCCSICFASSRNSPFQCILLQNITTFSVFFQYVVVKVHIYFKKICSKQVQAFINSSGDCDVWSEVG